MNEAQTLEIYERLNQMVEKIRESGAFDPESIESAVLTLAVQQLVRNAGTQRTAQWLRNVSDQLEPKTLN